MVVIEREFWRTGGHLRAPFHQFVHALRLEEVGGHRRDRVCAALLRVFGEQPGLGSAVFALTFTGVTGQIGFDKQGDVMGGAITLYRVKGGKWTVVEVVQSSTPLRKK